MSHPASAWLTAALVVLSLPLGAPAQDLLVGPPPPTEADALRAYTRGDTDAAAAAYRAIAARDPANVEARLDLARLLRQAGRLEEALVWMDALLSQRNDDRALRLEAAEAAVFAAQPGRGLAYLQPLPPSAESLYLTGLALMDQGHAAEAAAAFEASLQIEGFRPMAWYWTGTLRRQLGQLELAETALARALAQEPNLTETYLPLARVYADSGRPQKALALLRRALASRPDDTEIREMIAALQPKEPATPAGAELASASQARAAEARATEAARRAAAVVRKAEALSQGRDQAPQIRVGLAEGVRQLHLKASGPFTLFSGDPRAEGPLRLAEGSAGAVVSLAASEAQVEVTLHEAGQPSVLRAALPLTLAYADPSDATMVFDVQFGRGSFWAGSEDRSYRGKIEVIGRSGGLTIVNVVPIEEYLYSVVPSEMPASWPRAALEAQAVAARSYTLANLGRFASRGFDVHGDVYSAAYGGTANETPAVRAAIDATRGLVLLDAGKPLAAYYNANSGGHTEGTRDVWGSASSLPAVPDPLLAAQPFPLAPEALARWLADRPPTYSSRPDTSQRSAYRWQLWVPRREIERRLADGPRIGSVVGIAPGRRGVSGRVFEVRIQGTQGERTVRGDAIRGALGGLRSNLFTVEPKLGADGLPEYFVFAGAGWGHGVGLDQSGAAGMAADGIDAAAILRHYYGSAELRALY